MRKLILFSAIIFSFIAAPSVYASSSEEKSEGASEYVKIEPLILPVIDNDGVYQVLSLVVVIEVGGVNDAEKVKAKKPKLKDAYIQDMYGVLNESSAIRNGVVQVKIIKKRLNAITHKIMGDVETEVLLQVVQQLPI